MQRLVESRMMFLLSVVRPGADSSAPGVFFCRRFGMIDTGGAFAVFFPEECRVNRYRRATGKA